MKPAACVFDWDGTLVDTTEFIISAHSHVYKEMGLAAPDRKVLVDNMRFPTSVVYPRLFGDMSVQAIDVLDSYIVDNHLKALKVRDGVADFLNFLAEKDVPLAIVSNKRHKFLIKEVEKAGFEGLFGSAVVGAGHAHKDKPYAEPVYLVLERLGVNASSVSDCWFFGDTVTDLECAQALNMRYINCSENSAYCEDYFSDKVDANAEFVSFLEITKKLVCNF